jgi:hypothetical protein
MLVWRKLHLPPPSAAASVRVLLAPFALDLRAALHPRATPLLAPTAPLTHGRCDLYAAGAAGAWLLDPSGDVLAPPPLQTLLLAPPLLDWYTPRMRISCF